MSRKATANLRVSYSPTGHLKHSHEPRQREDVDRGLHSEERVPGQRRDHEDRTDDVQVELGLRVGSTQQRQLERGLSSAAAHPSTRYLQLTAEMSCPSEMMIAYNGQPASVRPMKICSFVIRASLLPPSSYISPP